MAGKEVANSPPLMAENDRLLEELEARARGQNISVSRQYLKDLLHEMNSDSTMAWNVLLMDHGNPQPTSPFVQAPDPFERPTTPFEEPASESGESASESEQAVSESEELASESEQAESDSEEPESEPEEPASDSEELSILSEETAIHSEEQSTLHEEPDDQSDAPTIPPTELLGESLSEEIARVSKAWREAEAMDDGPDKERMQEEVALQIKALPPREPYSPQVEELITSWEELEKMKNRADQRRALEEIIHQVKILRDINDLKTPEQTVPEEPNESEPLAKASADSVAYTKKNLVQHLIDHKVVDPSLQTPTKGLLENAMLELLKSIDKLQECHDRTRHLIFEICDTLGMINMEEVIEKFCNGTYKTAREASLYLKNQAGLAFFTDPTDEEQVIMDLEYEAYRALAKLGLDQTGRGRSTAQVIHDTTDTEARGPKYLIPRIVVEQDLQSDDKGVQTIGSVEEDMALIPRIVAEQDVQSDDKGVQTTSSLEEDMATEMRAMMKKMENLKKKNPQLFEQLWDEMKTLEADLDLAPATDMSKLSIDQGNVFSPPQTTTSTPRRRNQNKRKSGRGRNKW